MHTGNELLLRQYHYYDYYYYTGHWCRQVLALYYNGSAQFTVPTPPTTTHYSLEIISNLKSPKFHRDHVRYFIMQVNQLLIVHSVMHLKAAFRFLWKKQQSKTKRSRERYTRRNMTPRMRQG